MYATFLLRFVSDVDFMSMVDKFFVHVHHCVIDMWLLSSICIGMNYLHNEAPTKIIHRDLKSKNGNLN